MKRFLLTDKQETCYTIATGILTQYLLGEKRKYDSKGEWGYDRSSPQCLFFHKQNNETKEQVSSLKQLAESHGFTVAAQPEDAGDYRQHRQRRLISASRQKNRIP